MLYCKFTAEFDGEHNVKIGSAFDAVMDNSIVALFTFTGLNGACYPCQLIGIGWSQNGESGNQLLAYDKFGCRTIGDGGREGQGQYSPLAALCRRTAFWTQYSKYLRGSAYWLQEFRKLAFKC